ncbi:chain-length determining protein [Lactiplantibacillus plantarum]|nr:chain-length determining protein [Lactiplantibacillus plantarum]
MNETSHPEATLSIEDILLTLRKHLKIIIGSTIIVTLLAFVVTFFVMTPKYQSTTQLLVNRKLDDNQQTAVLQQTQADVQMINTYKDIITSPTILKDVAKDVGNGQTVGKLDLQYIEKSSFWFDLKIILMTVKIMIMPNSAY